jgi:mycothiol synthase
MTGRATTDGIALRAFRPDDEDWWVETCTTLDPLLNAEYLRRSLHHPDVSTLRMTVAEVGGGRVGVGRVLLRASDPNYFGQVLVEPRARGRGVGGALFADLCSVPHQLPWVTELAADPVSLAVAQHWGFEPVSLTTMARLRLDPAPTPPALADGVRLRVLTCDEVDAAGLAGPLDRLIAASETEPEAVELGWTETYDELRGRFPDVVWALLEVDGELVALSCADPQDGADWVLVYTGVSPPHRRRGLGRAVKQSLHAAIAARGARSIATQNDSRNVEVLGLNAQLGYVAFQERIRLRREPTASVNR